MVRGVFVNVVVIIPAQSVEVVIVVVVNMRNRQGSACCFGLMSSW